MIIVRVELHSAITGIVTEIARFDIWNTTNGSRTKGDYECSSFRGRTRDALTSRIVQRRGKIENHPRLSQHVLCLVHKALTSMGYGKAVEDDWTSNAATREPT